MAQELKPSETSSEMKAHIRTQSITAYRLTANDIDSGSHGDIHHLLSG